MLNSVVQLKAELVLLLEAEKIDFDFFIYDEI